MLLSLKLLPETVFGIYGDSGKEMPKRMRMLHPDAAASYLAIDALGTPLRVSDMFRSPEASLHAMQKKSGVQPPGFSAHNYGFAIDVETSDCMKRFKMTKKQFDEFMESQGWTCHRLDHSRGSEDWHYNFQVRHLVKAGETTSKNAVERKMQEFYGAQMILDVTQAQTALAKMRFYNGTVDGLTGPMTRAALEAFQRAWKVNETGLGPRTQRVLARCTAELSMAA